MHTRRQRNQATKEPRTVQRPHAPLCDSTTTRSKQAVYYRFIHKCKSNMLLGPRQRETLSTNGFVSEWVRRVVIEHAFVTSWRSSWRSFGENRMAAMWLCCLQYRVVVVVAASLDAHQVRSGALLAARDARRSRTRARSESSTSPNTRRPSIESSSSSRPLASSMMVHIDGDLVAM